MGREPFVQTEIMSQPGCWRRAVEVAARSQELLPRDGERVAVVGCGTSWFMAQAYASLRESGGRGETDAFAASEMPRGRSYDRLLAVTTLAFDISALELFLPLLSGARVEILDRSAASDPALLREAVGAGGGTVLQATPATWRLLLDAGWEGAESLRALSGSGRPLDRFHIVVGEAEMVADLVDQDMLHEMLERFLAFAPFEQDRRAIEEHLIGKAPAFIDAALG